MDLAPSLETGPFDPVASARDLQPWLRDQAARIEAANRVPDDVAARLVDAGMFRMTLPARYGGLECCPSTAWRATFEIARGCSSCAWLVGLITANILMLGKFSARAQEDVFGNGQPAIVPMLTGGVGHGITVTPVEGGIRLSGNWRYASGIDVARWLGLLIDLPRGDGMAPTLVLVPQSAFVIDHDSWQVLGMRGTGSKNVSLTDTFVPEHRFMDWSVLQAGGKHADCPNDAPVYDYPLNSVFAMSVAAPTLGVASAVAETYREVAGRRVNSGTKVAQIEDRASWIRLAAAEAVMSMAQDILTLDARSITAACTAGHEVSLVDRARYRMRTSRATSLALSEAQGIFRSIGGSLLPSGTRMERLFRDLHAMSSHFLLAEDPIGEIRGRMLLGLDLPSGARI